MDPLFVFLAAGAFSMSGAIFANALLKQPEAERPAWVNQRSGQIGLLLFGNLLALILIAAMVYGAMNLIWWIPAVCLFLSFPIIHVVILDKLFGPRIGVWISGLAALASLGVMIYAW